MTVIQARNIHEAYQRLLTILLDSQLQVVQRPRGSGTESFLTREQLGVVTLVQARQSGWKLTWPARRLAQRFAAAEWLWMLAGQEAVEPLAAWLPALRQYADDGVLRGAYGPRLMSQWSSIGDALTWLGSRQAVWTTWQPALLGSGVGDVPCTVGGQFISRHDELNLVVWMRSNDAWRGWPYDVMLWLRVLRLAAATLKLHAGWLMHWATSMHLYERDWDAARHLLKTLPGPPGDLERFDQSLSWNQIGDYAAARWHEVSAVVNGAGQLPNIQRLHLGWREIMLTILQPGETTTHAAPVSAEPLD